MLHRNSDSEGNADPVTWTSGANISLAAGALDLWRVALNQPTELVMRLSSCLAPDELDRANRFYFARDRDRFIVAHAALRLVLGRYTNAAPEVIRFSYGSFGKPELAFPQSSVTLDFNLSHAGDIAALAFALGRRVGVDVELVREDLPLKEVEAFLSPGEKRALSMLPAARRARAFYRCWCRREAYVKAVGLGLNLPLESMTVFSERGLSQLHQEQPCGDQVGGWSFEEPRLDPAYVCASVNDGGRARLRRFFCLPEAILGTPRG